VQLETRCIIKGFMLKVDLIHRPSDSLSRDHISHLRPELEFPHLGISHLYANVNNEAWFLARRSVSDDQR